MVRIEAERLENVVAVPTEAIVDTGERRIVFVAREGGRYVPRPVVPGLRGNDGFTEIREGLEEGEGVVVSGQFLLDGETQIEAALARLMATDTSTAHK
jgi:multidrug efflux pump subunit AcrA (membrane-fusion protein)